MSHFVLDFDAETKVCACVRAHTEGALGAKHVPI